MPRTEPFSDLAEFRAEKARLKALVDHHGDALTGYWELMHDVEFRHDLANSALEDLIRSWKPLRMVGSLFRSEQSTLMTLLISFLQPKSKSFKGRMMSWGIGLIAPILFRKLANSEWLHELVSRFTSSENDSSDGDDGEQEDD